MSAAPEADWSARFVDAIVPYDREDRGWAGTHCYGGVRLVFREHWSLELEDYGPARDRHRSGELMAAGARLGPWIDVSSKAVQNPLERRPFDVVVFDIAGIDDHCGILVTPTLMLHWSRFVGEGRVDEIDRGWGRLSGVYRHEALA